MNSKYCAVFFICRLFRLQGAVLELGHRQTVGLAQAWVRWHGVRLRLVLLQLLELYHLVLQFEMQLQ